MSSKNKQRVNLFLNPYLVKVAKLYAQKNRRSLSGMIEWLLLQYVEPIEKMTDDQLKEKMKAQVIQLQEMIDTVEQRQRSK